MIDERATRSDKTRWSGSILDRDRFMIHTYGEVLGMVRTKAQNALRDFPGYTVVELGIRRSDAGGWIWSFRLDKDFQ
jgi:hypothetical protein